MIPIRFLVGVWLTSVAFAQAPQRVALFEAGAGGYVMYHIPGVVVTARGSVLAWAEARRAEGDWSPIDIVLRRSTDDGLSWDAPRSVARVDGPIEKNAVSDDRHGKGITYNNPVLIAGRDGTVHMLFCAEYLRCFYQRSADDGVSWSRPVEITSAFEAFRPRYDWRVLATGPNHSIQLRSGRLLVPVWLSTGTGEGRHRPSVTATVFSDDNGSTWRAGEVAVPNAGEFINPNETTAVELPDGRVLLNVRNESKRHRRLLVTSPDGATQWSAPMFAEDLKEPICMGAMVRFSDRPSRILFSNPDNLESRDGRDTPGTARLRKNLTIKLSMDEGRTWPVSRVLEPGPSFYSDLAVTQRGTILCFYGSGVHGFAGREMTLARFGIDWVEGREK
jgi:sialidase-1